MATKTPVDSTEDRLDPLDTVPDPDTVDMSVTGADVMQDGIAKAFDLIVEKRNLLERMAVVRNSLRSFAQMGYGTQEQRDWVLKDAFPIKQRRNQQIEE
jgi:hypothetical protein